MLRRTLGKKLKGHHGSTQVENSGKNINFRKLERHRDAEENGAGGKSRTIVRDWKGGNITKNGERCELHRLEGLKTPVGRAPKKQLTHELDMGFAEKWGTGGRATGYGGGGS